MSVLNYFFTGVVVSLLVDLFLTLDYVKNHPLKIDKDWGWNERLICIIIWPIAALVFLYSFFKSLNK